MEQLWEIAGISPLVACWAQHITGPRACQDLGEPLSKMRRKAKKLKRLEC